jgi:hypothetical protein
MLMMLDIISILITGELRAFLRMYRNVPATNFLEG